MQCKLQIALIHLIKLVQNFLHACKIIIADMLFIWIIMFAHLHATMQHIQDLVLI